MSDERGGAIDVQQGDSRVRSIEIVKRSPRANAESRGSIDRTPGSKKDRRANADPLPFHLKMISCDFAAGRF